MNIFDISGRAMAAQNIRLNTIASNLANVNALAGSREEVYKPMLPVFETKTPMGQPLAGISTVDVVDIVRSTAEPEKRYSPGHPQANAEGFVFAPAIDRDQEMIDMIETSRQYQNNIEVLTTAKSLLLKTISVGK
jgi:flagellar basal-body rod protein FlgC